MRKNKEPVDKKKRASKKKARKHDPRRGMETR